jgi:hypothetical protein
MSSSPAQPDPTTSPGVNSKRRRHFEKARPIMTILGIVALIAGILLKAPILWTVGIILAVVGAIPAILGSTGRAVAGRLHYF